MDVLNKKWLQRHFSLTKEIASWSKDPDTQVGALIVKNTGEPVSWGYNGIPMAVNDHPTRLIRPTKYHFMAHAERNAMDLSSRNNFVDCTLFCTHSPCSGCATSIVNRRMSNVVCLAENGFLRKSFVTRHPESLECHNAALEMFTEADILYHEYDPMKEELFQITKLQGESIYVRKIHN